MAHDHGGMSGDSMPGMSTTHGTMTSYLHLNPGDTLWIDGWVPGRSSTLWAACIALTLLGIGHRWLAAARAAVERAIYCETCVHPVYVFCDLDLGGLPVKMLRIKGESCRCWR